MYTYIVKTVVAPEPSGIVERIGLRVCVDTAPIGYVGFKNLDGRWVATVGEIECDPLPGSMEDAMSAVADSNVDADDLGLYVAALESMGFVAA